MRILILRHIEKNSMDDIFHQTDYTKYEWIKATNVGNKLWLMGLVSTIATPENQIDFLESYMDADYINANYDICIKPEANIFSPRFIGGMKRHVERFGNIQIPIYVIACGAAAKSYDELDELCSAIREPAMDFIKSVYKTGGEFCLRGFFTKEMFDKLGFHDAVVTGCPSLYQLGRDLSICEDKVKQDAFRAVLNGSIDLVRGPLKRYACSEFVDQGIFYPLLYAADNQLDTKSCVKTYGTYGIKLCNDHRVKLWIDLQDWADYLLDEQFVFSCGSRIHGNIMPILCGIPAAICPPDARVREMAEFYDIPMISETDLKKRDLYEIYLNTDYQTFNRNFASKHDAYERFLVDHRIVRSINDKPMLRTERFMINKKRLDEIQNMVQTERINIIHSRVANDMGWHMYEKTRKASIKILEKIKR